MYESIYLSVYQRFVETQFTSLTDYVWEISLRYFLLHNAATSNLKFWEDSGLSLGVLWAHFGSTLGVTLGVFWAHFKSIPGSLWEYSLLTLKLPKGHFGSTLGSLWKYPKGLAALTHRSLMIGL